ncbi:hypothetical protein ANANG_G00031090 [Anguilla anguilla]|uniref:A-kinase anchor protein 2 C-terminal domain-containing protein n=1 Tax=Anguilla anguilla TaxID=7936 RepID=A0A9D3MS04_ANGAN|nr:hypothetical protein ANANG_G00031090 [Anguilla anguilla]
MEPSNNSVTIATEAITSPQSSVSQEDWGWMEGSGSDSDDRDSGRDNSPPMTNEATRAGQEDTWPDVTQPEWPMEEPCLVISAETSDGSDREIEACHFPEPSASQTWPVEGDNEGDSRQDPEGEASTPGTSQTSLRQQQQDGFLQHGTVADSQQGELLLQRLCLLQQKQEVQQVFEGSPPLATVALEPASQRPGCHGSACVVVREWAGRRREGEEKGSEQTGEEARQSVAGLHTGEEANQEQRERGAESAQRGETKANGGREGQSNPPAHRRGSRMEASNGEDNQSDSGEDPDACPAPLNETPIEREIRRAVEREQSLRRSRGLDRTQEFVEIPLRKPVLSRAVPSRAAKGEGTDRQFAGKKMLKEISVEAQREEVLVLMGKLPGVYDKGTVRQLREKKQLFEAFQEKREPSGSLTPLSKRPSFSASDISAAGSQTGDGPNAGPVLESGHGLDQIAQKQDQKPGSAGYGDEDFGNTHRGLCGPTLSEGTSSQIIILENNVFLHTPVPNPDGLQHPSHSTGSLPEAHDVTVVDSGTVGEGRRVVGEAAGTEEAEEEEEEEDIQEGRQRERELRRQRSSLYGTTGAGGGRPASTGTRSPTPSQNGLSASELPSYTTSPTPSARQSLGKLDLTWPPAQPSAEVTGQTEAPRSRRKTQLLQRWESGVVNGHEEEQD